jgi:winged helix DNA-binding protein
VRVRSRPMAARISWAQALAWRMRRHLLDPVGELSVADVVSRLCGVQTQVASSAELAVRVRRFRSRRGEVERALREGRLIKTWAMRGTLHLLTPHEAGAFLSLIASGRSWERPSWQRYFGVSPKQMEALRLATPDILGDGPLTREELVAAITARRGLEHVGEELRSGWGTLLKPLAWQGALCSGPSLGNRVTFMRPEDASAEWRPLPEPDVAAPIAMSAYLRAYGPATADAFGNWLAGGYFGKRQLHAWFAALEERLATVEVDGEPMVVLAEDLPELLETRPTRAVRLLPGFDQYVLGPGTADGHVVRPARRAAVSRQAGWISPIVVAGGVVGGTWELDATEARITWFAESGRPPRARLRGEVVRIAEILGRELRPSVTVVD